MTNHYVLGNKKQPGSGEKESGGLGGIGAAASPVGSPDVRDEPE